MLRRAARLGRRALQGAEEFVEFVGGVEVGFEFAGAEAVAEIVEAAGEEIEGGGENFAVGEYDVAPGGVGAAGEAQGIAEARAGERDGQAVFVETIVEERAESDGGELREMRGQADGVIVLLRAEPEGARADLLQNFEEGDDAGIAMTSSDGADERIACCCGRDRRRRGRSRKVRCPAMGWPPRKRLARIVRLKRFGGGFVQMRTFVLQASVTRACGAACGRFREEDRAWRRWAAR